MGIKDGVKGTKEGVIGIKEKEWVLRRERVMKTNGDNDME